jgi:histidinol-phosphate phosphatase family protein
VALSERSERTSGEKRPAVFLDKDGTLIENVPYNVNPARIALAPGAAEGAAALSRRGYRLIVVSNQPGAALGYFQESALAAVEHRVRELLAEAGAQLDGFYYCPHLPGAGCGCRKPAAGLLVRAAQDRHIDLASSWMIGDILDDVEAGRRAGCRTVLVDNGNETEWHMNAQRRPDAVVKTLREAAARVLAERP